MPGGRKVLTGACVPQRCSFEQHCQYGKNATAYLGADGDPARNRMSYEIVHRRLFCRFQL